MVILYNLPCTLCKRVMKNVGRFKRVCIECKSLRKRKAHLIRKLKKK